MSESIRDELILVLYEKLAQLEKMRGHLAYSQKNAMVFMPLVTIENLDESRLETLAALKGRFSELQDHLASAMKLIAELENKNAAVFTYVINYMEKIGVVADFHRWNKLRELRNDAAYAYDDDITRQTGFYNELFSATPELFQTLVALHTFCLKTYPEGNVSVK